MIKISSNGGDQFIKKEIDRILGILLDEKIIKGYHYYLIEDNIIEPIYFFDVEINSSINKCKFLRSRKV